MITENEINKLKEIIYFKFHEANLDYMVFDIDAEIDRSLNYEENLNILIEKTEEIIGRNFKQIAKEQKSQEGLIKEQEEKFISQYKANKEENLFIDQNNFLIIGKKGSGKTALGWSFLKKINEMSQREIYIFNHPRPEILKELPFKVSNLLKLEQLYNITDSVVLIDEAQLVFNVMDKKINNRFKNLLAISRQNNVCFIFICHNSYFINRSLFSFIDVKIIKDVNEGHWSLERKHMAKLYEDIVIYGKNSFFIDSDYIRGQQSFIKPTWFSDDLSLGYRFNTSKKNFFA